MKKTLVLSLAVAIVGILFWAISAFSAPITTYFRDIGAEIGSTHSIGSLTRTFLNVFSDNVYVTNLTSEDCVGTDSNGKLVSGTCTGGGGSADGDAGAIQFSDGSGNFVASSTFKWIDTVGQLQVGTPTSTLDGDPSTPLVVTGNTNSYYQIVCQNQNTGDSASCDFIVSADNDDQTVESGTYGNFGIANSGYQYTNSDLVVPGDTYLAANGGNLIISSYTSGKHIDFTTGGDLLDNRRIRIEDARTTFYANYEDDIAPDVSSSTLWTTNNGWSVSGGLLKATDTVTGIAYPTSSTTINAGTTYLVTITATSTVGSPTYSIGGVQGSIISDGTFSDSIVALTTDDIIFTGASTTETLIESLTIEPKVPDTGNIDLQGDLYLGGSIATINNDPIFNISGEGIVTFPNIPLLPATLPTSDLQATSKVYVDSLLTTGARFVSAVRAATTAALPSVTYNNGSSGVGATLTATANGALSAQDGVTLNVGQMLLVKNQANQAHNGAYSVTTVGDGSNPFVLTRIASYNESSEIVAGTFFTVLEGTTNGAEQWAMNNDTTITVGTTDITFSQLSQPIVYTSGDNAISILGTVISLVLSTTNPALEIVGDGLRVLVDNSTIERSSLGLAIKDGGVTASKLATAAVDLAGTKITGILGLVNGGTGATTAQGARTNILPTQTGNNGKALVTNGTDVSWSTVAGGSATTTLGSTFTTVTFISTPQTAQTWTTQPAAETEIFGNVFSRQRVDLTRGESFYITGRQAVAGFAGATMKMQCSADGTTWADAGDANASIDIGTLGTQPRVGNLSSLATGCKGFVYVRLVGVNGNATASPSWRNLYAVVNNTRPENGSTATTTVEYAVASTPQTVQTWTNQPAAVTELFGATNARFTANTINATHYRLVVNQSVAGTAGADFNLQCSADNTTFIAADTGGAGEVDVGTGTGVKTGNETALVSGCKASRYWRIVGKQGNGVDDPAYRQIKVQFTVTESALGGGGSGTNDWSYGTNFGTSVLTPSTTIPVWFKAPIYASSTATFGTSTQLILGTSMVDGGNTYPSLAGVNNVGGKGIMIEAGEGLYVKETPESNVFPTIALIGADGGSSGSIQLATTTRTLALNAESGLLLAQGDLQRVTIGGNELAENTKLAVTYNVGDAITGYNISTILTDNESANVQGIIGAKIEAGSLLPENTYIGSAGAANISSSTASTIGVLGVAAGGLNNYAGYFIGNVLTNGIDESVVSSSTFYCLNGDCISSWTGGSGIWEYGTNYGDTVITTTSTDPLWLKGMVYASSSILVAPSSSVGISIDASNVPIGLVSQSDTQNGGQIGIASIMDGTTLGALSYYARDLFTSGDEYNVGVFGTSFKTTSTAGNIGVYASAGNSGLGNIAGLFETANSDYTAWLGLDGAYAVGGSAGSSTNPLNIGVYGQAQNGPDKNWAGYFESNVFVEDHFTVGSTTVDQYPLFVQDNSSTTAPTSIKFTSREFLGGAVNGPIIEAVASNGVNGLGVIRDFSIFGGSSFNPALLFNSQDVLQNASIGYTTSTDVMSFNNALGGYTFNTVGNNNTSLTIKELDASGSLFTNLKVPMLYGRTESSDLGTLNALGVNNGILIIEEPSQNSDPVISFGSADFGDTGNAGAISYSTSSNLFYFDKKLKIDDSNGDPRIEFSINNSATSSEIFLTEDDSMFFTGASNGYYHDASIAILNDNYPAFVFGSADGSAISAISYQSSTDTMTFTQASGGYEFDNLPSVGSDPMCWDGSGSSLIGDCSSLRKFKTNEQAFTSGLADILKLTPKTYDWKRNEDGSLSDSDYAILDHDTGFIAEDVALVNPSFGRYNKGELQDVNERGILGAIINSIKEMFNWLQMQHSWNSDQDKEIEMLKAEIKSLKEQIK